IRPLLRRSMRAVDGDAIETHGVIVCGTRGIPVTASHSTESLQTTEREIESLETSLEMATALRTDRAIPLYVLWHFPPFDAHGRPGPCVDRLERAQATACVYGHLHNQSEWSVAAQGIVRGIRYHCVAADAIGFRPLRIMAVPRSAGPDTPK